jgi:hypothetical protein
MTKLKPAKRALILVDNLRQSDVKSLFPLTEAV